LLPVFVDVFVVSLCHPEFIERLLKDKLLIFYLPIYIATIYLLLRRTLVRSVILIGPYPYLSPTGERPPTAPTSLLQSSLLLSKNFYFKFLVMPLGMILQTCRDFRTKEPQTTNYKP